MLHEISKSEAVSLLCDDYVSKILVCTNVKARSTKEISEMEDIPLAVCYRRINKLVDLGLLKKAERVLTNDGKRVWLYESNLKKAAIVYEDANIKAYFKLKDGIEEHFGFEEKYPRPISVF